jgi:hypothetical protein
MDMFTMIIGSSKKIGENSIEKGIKSIKLALLKYTFIE